MLENYYRGDLKTWIEDMQAAQTVKATCPNYGRKPIVSIGDKYCPFCKRKLGKRA